MNTHYTYIGLGRKSHQPLYARVVELAQYRCARHHARRGQLDGFGPRGGYGVRNAAAAYDVVALGVARNDPAERAPAQVEVARP